MATTFTAHEGQDTVLVRGSMHHTAMTVTEFEEWLVYENCSVDMRSSNDNSETYFVKRNDGSVRSVAVVLSSSAFDDSF